MSDARNILGLDNKEEIDNLVSKEDGMSYIRDLNRVISDSDSILENDSLKYQLNSISIANEAVTNDMILESERLQLVKELMISENGISLENATDIMDSYISEGAKWDNFIKHAKNAGATIKKYLKMYMEYIVRTIYLSTRMYINTLIYLKNLIVVIGKKITSGFNGDVWSILFEKHRDNTTEINAYLRQCGFIYKDRLGIVDLRYGTIIDTFIHLQDESNAVCSQLTNIMNGIDINNITDDNIKAIDGVFSSFGNPAFDNTPYGFIKSDERSILSVSEFLVQYKVIFEPKMIKDITKKLSVFEKMLKLTILGAQNKKIPDNVDDETSVKISNFYNHYITALRKYSDRMIIFNRWVSTLASSIPRVIVNNTQI